MARLWFKFLLDGDPGLLRIPVVKLPSNVGAAGSPGRGSRCGSPKIKAKIKKNSWRTNVLLSYDLFIIIIHGHMYNIKEELRVKRRVMQDFPFQQCLSLNRKKAEQLQWSWRGLQVEKLNIWNSYLCRCSRVQDRGGWNTCSSQDWENLPEKLIKENSLKFF